jgi:hypothetical protein
MKILQSIRQQTEQTGMAIIQNRLTQEEIIITMPADRFSRFLRKFRNHVGRQVEVANGWIFPVGPSMNSR